MRRVLGWRRGVQLAVLLLFVLLPWLNRAGFTGMKGTLFAFDAFGIPLTDPLNALQLAALQVPLEGALLGGSVLVLGLALCLGRVFCSWLCPVGLLSEGVYRVRGRLTHQPMRQGMRWRGTVAVLGMVGVVWFGVPLLNQLSMMGTLSLGFSSLASDRLASTAGWLANLVAVSLPLLPVLIVLGVDAITRRRFWCTFCCPQSVLLSLASATPLAPCVQHTNSPCVCGSKPACRAACSLQLDPRRRVSSWECTRCGACVLACAGVHGTASPRLALRWLKPRGWRKRVERSGAV